MEIDTETQTPESESADPRRIARYYLATFTALLGLGLLGPLVVELAYLFGLLKGDSIRNLRASHGLLMVFLLVIPSIPSVIGNIALPKALGVARLIMPRVNLVSLWLYWAGAFITIAGVVFSPRLSWTFADLIEPSSWPVGVIGFAGVIVVSLSGLLGAVNVISTIRERSSIRSNLPEFPALGWAAYAASLLSIWVPVPLIASLVVLIMARMGNGILDTTRGGDPVLFQRLFWYAAQPMIMSSLIWAMGVISEILRAYNPHSRASSGILKRSFFAIAVLSAVQGDIHLAGTSTEDLSSFIGSFFTLLGVVPISLVIASCVVGLKGSEAPLRASVILAISVIINLTIWVASTVVLGSLSAGSYLRGTFFETSSAHYALLGGTLTAMIAGLLHWWQQLTARQFDEKIARTGSIGIFIGLTVSFIGPLTMGFMGQIVPSGSISFVVTSLVGAIILVASLGLLVWELGNSLKSRPRTPEHQHSTMG